MVDLVYLQCRKAASQGTWNWDTYMFADTSVNIEDFGEIADRCDMETGRRRPWRIIRVDGNSDPIVLWENDAAKMLAEATTKIAKKKAQWKPKPINYYELAVCSNATHFTVNSPDGRHVLVQTAASYLEALILRDQSGLRRGLIYAVNAAGRSCLVTEWLGEQLMKDANPLVTVDAGAAPL